MKKSKILEMYEQNTGISYKHQPIFVGDVYKGNMGVLGIVVAEEIDGEIKYFLHKRNTCKHKLPEDKAGFNDGTFIANVVQDESLMQQFIDCGIIQDDTKEEKSMVEETKEVVETPVTTHVETLDGQTNKEVVVEVVKEVKTKKTAKKEAKEVVKEPTLNIYQKINLIRKAWAGTDVEKEGKGKLGGAGKFNYYKPQQIIDFCLAQELKHNLYSKFSIVDDRCFYELINLDNIEEAETVACPFEMPRKMVVNEAQQAGAALTYFNRRLAMMMYKIEDNSKESVDVLADVANTKDDINAPEIPAPPIMPTAPVSAPVNVPTLPVSDQVNVPVNAPIAPVSVPVTPPVTQQVAEVTPPWEDTKTQNIPTPPVPPVQQTQAEQVKEVFAGQEVAPPPVATPVQTPPPAPKMGSIESLY